MRKWIALRPLGLFVLSIFASAIPAISQDIPCTATTLLAKQHRSNMKHRDPAPGPPEARTVVQALQWSAPVGMQTAAVRKQDTPYPGREQDGKIYEITGDLWRVKLESNDCDFHLEISAPGQLKTANRIIVELPQGPLFVAARQKLIDELIANGYDPAVDKPLDLDEPLRIKVIGFPFYDSAHYSKKYPKRGHGHGTAKVGTLWELHPFWDIQFIEQP